MVNYDTKVTYQLTRIPEIPIQIVLWHRLGCCGQRKGAKAKALYINAEALLIASTTDAGARCWWEKSGYEHNKELYFRSWCLVLEIVTYWKHNESLRDL